MSRLQISRSIHLLCFLSYFRRVICKRIRFILDNMLYSKLLFVSSSIHPVNGYFEMKAISFTPFCQCLLEEHINVAALSALCLCQGIRVKLNIIHRS